MDTQYDLQTVWEQARRADSAGVEANARDAPKAMTTTIAPEYIPAHTVRLFAAIGIPPGKCRLIASFITISGATANATEIVLLITTMARCGLTDVRPQKQPADSPHPCRFARTSRARQNSRTSTACSPDGKRPARHLCRAAAQPTIRPTNFAKRRTRSVYGGCSRPAGLKRPRTSTARSCEKVRKPNQPW